MKKIIAIFTVFLLSLSAYGLDFKVPEQKIVGAEKPIELGELVSLKLSKAESEYLDKASVDWTVYESKDGSYVKKNFQVVQDGVFFGAGIKPKKLLVIASVSYFFVLKDKDGKITSYDIKTKTLSTELQIGDNALPPSDPDPTVPPTPSDPLAETIKAMYGAIQEPDRVKNARGLVEVYKFGILSLSAGVVTTPNQLFVAMDTKAKDLQKNNKLKKEGLLSIQEKVDTELNALMPTIGAEITPDQKTLVLAKLKVISDTLNSLSIGGSYGK